MSDNKKKIIINKEFLKDYESLSIGLENCDVYKISTLDILDIYCQALLVHENDKIFCADDGFIKISASAKDTIESSTAKNNLIGSNFDLRLRQRLEMCDGCADMTTFSLKDKQKYEINICVPYDPLIEVLRGAEIELSNCPSLEFDSEENMIIRFGESSKQPKRKDNNYTELIAGWKEAFGDYSPNHLTVKVDSLNTFGDKQTNFSCSFQICDKNCKIESSELVFLDCQNIALEMFYPLQGDCDIVMSKLADGRIYVGFDGLGIGFICSSVLENNYFCNQDDNED